MRSNFSPAAWKSENCLNWSLRSLIWKQLLMLTVRHKLRYQQSAKGVYIHSIWSLKQRITFPEGNQNEMHPEKNNIKLYSFEVCQRSWPPQWGTRSQGTKTKYGKYFSKQNAVLRTPDPAKCLQMVSKQWVPLARPHKYMTRRSQLPLLAFFLGILSTARDCAIRRHLT